MSSESGEERLFVTQLGPKTSRLVAEQRGRHHGRLQRIRRRAGASGSRAVAIPAPFGRRRIALLASLVLSLVDVHVIVLVVVLVIVIHAYHPGVGFEDADHIELDVLTCSAGDAEALRPAC